MRPYDELSIYTIRNANSISCYGAFAKKMQYKTISILKRINNWMWCLLHVLRLYSITLVEHYRKNGRESSNEFHIPSRFSISKCLYIISDLRSFLRSKFFQVIWENFQKKSENFQINFRNIFILIHFALIFQ
jgi:hypothetical protein